MATLTIEQQVSAAMDGISQNAHMLMGGLYVILFGLFHKPEWLWIGIPVFILWTIWKEFVFDMKYEIAEIRLSSWKDFWFYQIGWAGGLGLVELSSLIS